MLNSSSFQVSERFPRSGEASALSRSRSALSVRGGLVWPMDIVPGRSVLVNRVENIPAPPAFIFEAFDSSQPLAAARCEPIDEHPASRRILRGGKVDCAPCVSVDEPAEEVLPEANSVEVAPRIPRPKRISRQAICREPIRREPSRRALRSRTILSKPAQAGESIANALSELEAAFENSDNSPLSTLLRIDAS